ncbi:MAG: tyrosine-type recombinase/integrase [Cryomorphaceae bacterium]|nr:tyrosine-type recombinase/integrase [Cryomorphaceae bacterium]
MSEIDKFTSYLRSEKRSSAHTVQAYRTDIEQFKAYIQYTFEESDILKATSVMVRSWIASMKTEGFRSRSMHRKRSSLSSFYKYARRQGWLTVDPVKRSVAPKMEKRLPIFVDEKGMQDLLEGPGFFEDDFFGLRDRLMVTLLYECGIRRAELIGIKDEDIDMGRQQVRIFGKRNKERVIPVSEATLKMIAEYRQQRDAEFVMGHSHLLCTDRGSKVYPKFVYERVNLYLGRVSTIEKRSPHILRHTFATHMLNNGAQLNSVKELLGHSSLAATQIYTHNTIEKLKSIHEQNHPKG